MARAATDPETLTRAMGERELQQVVYDLARYCGYLAYHTLMSRGSAAGFPDLVLVGRRGTPVEGRLIFAELKADRGLVTPAQREWRAALDGVPGAAYHLWRPSDWRSGAIERALRGEG